MACALHDPVNMNILTFYSRWISSNSPQYYYRPMSSDKQYTVGHGSTHDAQLHLVPRTVREHHRGSGACPQ